MAGLIQVGQMLDTRSAADAYQQMAKVGLPFAQQGTRSRTGLDLLHTHKP
jgi:hypothetical protein